MGLHWTDSFGIAESLCDKYSEQDPAKIRFTQLRELVLNLDEFDDDPEHCGERVLEAIQQAWIDEVRE